MLQVLTCQAGHTWERESQRGRKPLWCPNHLPVTSRAAVESDEHVETLTCAYDGHTWQRPKARGRKPPFCPDHRPQAIDSTETVVSVPSTTILTPAVEEVLAGPITELQRKLQYTVDALSNPLKQSWREKEDWTSLIETHKRLREQAEREIRKPAIVEIDV